MGFKGSNTCVLLLAMLHGALRLFPAPSVVVGSLAGCPFFHCGELALHVLQLPLHSHQRGGSAMVDAWHYGYVCLCSRLRNSDEGVAVVVGKSPAYLSGW